MQINKKTAMTYIELIMVMGIIGVIAAVSLPALKKHSQKTEMATLAKKAYLNIEDAMDNAILTEGPMRNWDFTDNKIFCRKYLAPNINTLQNNCEAHNSIVTRDGMLMQIAECDGSFCHVHVNVKGPNAPQNVGKNFFEYQVNRIDKGGINKAETVQPAPHGGAILLRENNWKFTDELWRKDWTKTEEGEEE